MRHVTPLRLTLGLLLLAGPAFAQPMGKEPGYGDDLRQMQRDRTIEQRDRMVDQRGLDLRSDREERRFNRREAHDARESLRDAQEAVQQGQFGLAGEYLQRAATRILSRGNDRLRARDPARDRSLEHISEAREALNRRDPRRAMQQIERAIESVQG